ncbi:two-component response regulator-like APRR1 isoform X3 [Brassica rapa]|uniref:two-component response regulator-like APRR1 isoform X3 n=1 Tax=Brassica campestris TaxID=3711 RepID=UPI0004F172B9|nr:two-component response regulator-like APRR1 isoform X3 [Brassica rapa]XP_013670438.1 two-component response regulator-like APRR1 isoform X3 [Brassica napus]
MASSLPQFYSDFTFSGETPSQFHGSSSYPDVSALSNYFDDGYGSFNPSSNPESMFFPQVFGVSDVSVPDYNNYYQKVGVNVNGAQYFHVGDQECYGYSPEIKPLFHPSTGEKSWQGNSEGGIQAEPNIKVGRYSVEERKDRIMRYLKKKNQRNFNKTIKYVCRKTLADRRVRVRGRFARNNDTSEQQSHMSKNHNNHSEKDEDMLSGSDDYLIQMETDDGWLQEAMSNLISFPCELNAPGDAHHPNTWSF